MRTKILGLSIGLVLGTGFLVILSIKFVLANKILAEFLKRGSSIARQISRQSVQPLLSGDMMYLKLMVDDCKEVNENVEYAFITNQDNAVMASTFKDGIPKEIKEADGPEIGREGGITIIASGKDKIYDVAWPIVNGTLGVVHIGMEGRPIREGVSRAIRLILAITLAVLLVGCGSAVVISRIMTEKLERLVEAAHIIKGGDLDHKVTVDSSDEIGDLGMAFNRMIDELSGDIAARRKVEEDLTQANERLERQNEELKKMDRMKDNLVRGVSHELKTPIAKHAMQMEILSGLLAGCDLPDSARNVMKTILETIHRQEAFVHNLLDLSRLEAGVWKYKNEPVDLSKVIKDVLSDYRETAAARGVEISTDLQSVVLKSDGDMLSHVFSNLINNTLKFMDDRRPGRVEISLKKLDHNAVARVTDNGIGMSAEEQQKAFEKFYRGSSIKEGSGVGLSICKMIVDDLGGRITIESAGRGLGTTVAVTLPEVGPQSAKGGGLDA